MGKVIQNKVEHSTFGKN